MVPKEGVGGLELPSSTLGGGFKTGFIKTGTGFVNWLTGGQSKQEQAQDILRNRGVMYEFTANKRKI